MTRSAILGPNPVNAHHVPSLRSSEAGLSAANPGTIAAAKRASLTAEFDALYLQQNLPEEELRLKQQQEKARLRLEQCKQQFQLHTKIAKMEAEEQVYAVAEQGDHYFRQPFPVQTQDL